MAKTYQINTSAKVNGPLSAEEAEGQWVFTNNLSPAIVIRPSTAPGESQVLFQISDSSQGTKILSMDYGGNIRAKSITVDSLIYEEEGSTQGDLHVTGSITVDGGASIGDNSHQDAVNIFGELQVWRGAKDGTPAPTRVFYVDARSSTANIEANGNLVVTGTITENGTLLSSRYSNINHNHDSVYLKMSDASNTYVRQDGSTPINGDQEFKKGSGTITIGGTTNADSIDSSGKLNINPGGQDVDVGGNLKAPKISSTGDIEVTGKITASNILPHSLVISAEETYATWDHNYGSTSYVVSHMSNSPSRHIFFKEKKDNSIEIHIDDEHDEPITIDLLLVGV